MSDKPENGLRGTTMLVSKEEASAIVKARATGVSYPQFRAGANRSVGRLRALNFDPIGELVHKYRKLEEELDRQEKRRSGELVELNSMGKPRAFRHEDLVGVYDRLIDISEKLLRYRYGRVPELENNQKPTAPLIVNLTKKGDVYTVNENELTDANQDDDDEDLDDH